MIGHLKAGQAPSGRMTVEGRIVAVKLRESECWGVQCVMVVLSRCVRRRLIREYELAD